MLVKQFVTFPRDRRTNTFAVLHHPSSVQMNIIACVPPSTPRPENANAVPPNRHIGTWRLTAAATKVGFKRTVDILRTGTSERMLGELRKLPDDDSGRGTSVGDASNQFNDVTDNVLGMNGTQVVFSYVQEHNVWPERSNVCDVVKDLTMVMDARVETGPADSHEFEAHVRSPILKMRPFSQDISQATYVRMAHYDCHRHVELDSTRKHLQHSVLQQHYFYCSNLFEINRPTWPIKCLHTVSHHLPYSDFDRPTWPIEGQTDCHFYT